MNSDLRRDLMVALERPHRLGTIGGDLEEQLAHSASCSSVLAEVQSDFSIDTTHGRGVDLGTGGGLPGLVMASLWPLMRWTLVDMRVARATEVERTVLRLGLEERVSVIASEAQYLGHDAGLRESFDVAVARAFGPPSSTAECATGLVRVGGVVVVSEPPDGAADRNLRWPTDGLSTFGFSLPHFYALNGHGFVVFEKVEPADQRFPRLPPRANRGWPKPLG